MSIFSTEKRDCVSLLYGEEGVSLFSVERKETVSLLYIEEGVFLFPIEKRDIASSLYREEGVPCLSSRGETVDRLHRERDLPTPPAIEERDTFSLL